MNTPETITLEPGMIFEVSDIAQLPRFEDAVALAIHPRMTRLQRERWGFRPHLRDLIRPRDFNGSFIDITLEVMERPYERLLDAHERGLKFADGSKTHKRTESEKAKDNTDKYVGLVFSALAKSTGRGVVGEIQSELWYYPVPMYRALSDGGRFRRSMNTYGGSPIGRTVAKPRNDPTVFKKILDESRFVAFALNRFALQHPYRG